MGTTRAENIFNHLASLRFETVTSVAAQVAKLARTLIENIPGPFIAVLIFCSLSPALNILALAGTIKTAALLLFDWTRALELGTYLGFSMDGVTKTDITWIACAVIIALYLAAGTAVYFKKRSKANLRGHAEVLVYDRFLNHNQLDRLLQLPDILKLATKSSAAYSRSSTNLAEGLSLMILCTVILIVLSIYLPYLIALVLIILLPIQLYFLLTGRRAGFSSKKINDMEARRRELLNQLVAQNLEKTAEPTPRAKLQSEYLQLTREVTRRRTAQMGATATPDVILSAVTGLVLAGAMVFLSGLETDQDSLIYLLIGFILIRFLFLFLRNVLMQAQSVMQNLDQIRFVNETILSSTISEDALPSSDPVPADHPDDYDELT